MKKLLTFIIGVGVWYGIFAFIMWEPHACTWHWGVRLVYSLFVIGTMRTAFED